ncbi:hypothetical protein JJJ17_17475 [Paracoccus caeni]|uniref:Uncharacterized protein n=1 Tax=Paracoccus caeni TaxID=657651 RepID=A0A934VW69_9RHOB|nr:hypothetical protein [Paracoccus caeni]MBK4217726.1 hypothetical protein [Paracoccus caeni]
MNRTEFITVTAIILFAVFVLGWLASWIIHRLFRSSPASMTDLDHLAEKLHDTEKQRDDALTALRERETALNARLTEAEGELQVAMEGLRESRTEVEELRDYIEKRLARR